MQFRVKQIHEKFYVIQRRTWWWPFWDTLDDECFFQLSYALERINVLKERAARYPQYHK